MFFKVFDLVFCSQEGRLKERRQTGKRTFELLTGVDMKSGLFSFLIKAFCTGKIYVPPACSVILPISRSQLGKGKTGSFFLSSGAGFLFLLILFLAPSSFVRGLHVKQKLLLTAVLVS